MNKNLTTAAAKFAPSLAALALLVGCGDRGPDRVIVSGKATYQGQPIELGQINFFPTADTPAPMSGTHIINGEYRVSAKGGVPVGSYTVEIIAYREKNKSAREDAEQASGKEQYLPPKYNQQSDLRLTVEPGPPVTHDFRLD